MSHHDERKDAIKKIAGLIKGIDIAMLTTIDEDGSLRSRPMAAQKLEFDGDLWFFTWADSPKVDEAQQHRQVNVSFANPNKQDYVSLSGTAQVLRDRKKAEELWNPFLRTWFPDGLDDPNLALLKVHVEKGEYWDSPSSTVVHLFGFVKAVVMGKPPSPGENEKVDLEQTRG